MSTLMMPVLSAGSYLMKSSAIAPPARPNNWRRDSFNARVNVSRAIVLCSGSSVMRIFKYVVSLARLSVRCGRNSLSLAVCAAGSNLHATIGSCGIPLSMIRLTQLNALSICSIHLHGPSTLPVPATSIHVCRLFIWPVLRCRQFNEYRTLSECLISIKNVVGGEPSYEDLRKKKCLRVYSGFFCSFYSVLLLRAECSIQFARVFFCGVSYVE
mmetsp:Transcript_35310/g.59520  ORF Transcript_35310/g.59520 Transcript_35310/m.59520 type:complete len:213 (+) Transcript_35310:682-1320(+)